MKNGRRIFALICLLSMACIFQAFSQEIPAANPIVKTGGWSAILGTHPVLFGSKERLRALAKENPEAYGEIRKEKELMFLCITQAVEGLKKDKIESVIAQIMKKVDAGASNKHQDTWTDLTDAALVYDYFYEEIPAEKRKKIVDWMNAVFEGYTDDENFFHNSTLSKILTYLRIAYATWKDNPKAKDFRNKALVQLYENGVVPVLNKYGAGGGWTECGWYQRHSVWHLTQALDLARMLEGYDGFQKSPKFFYQRLAYELHQPYPGFADYGCENYAMEGDGSNIYGGGREYPRLSRNIIARYFGGSELSKYMANKTRNGSNSMMRAFDFLYGNVKETPLDLKNLPLAHLVKDAGKVYARDGWGEDATWFRFECSDYWNQHQHLETGNFEIFRYDQLATESGEYKNWSSPHAVNWLTRTIAHNCLLVAMPGEEWKNYRGGKYFANDGGQAKKWDTVAANLLEWELKKAKFTRGKITAFENTPGFMYVAGDCSKAYSAKKVRKYVRKIVFLRPGVFVILDRVEAVKAEYGKTWLLHCKNEPELKKREFTVKNGEGTLNCYALLPEKTVFNKIKGYTYGGEDFPETESALTEAADLWRVEVKPEGSRSEDIFLNVLSTAGEKKPVLIKKGSAIGVNIDGNEVVFEGEAGGYVLLNNVKYILKEEVIAGKYEK